MNSDLTVKQLKDLEYDLVLLGHIHKHQTLTKKIVVLGSCMQHSFHETGEEKYYFILDTKTGKLQRHKIGAPKFILHEIRNKKGLEEVNVKDGNYHRINVMTPDVTAEDVAPLLARNVVINFSRTTSYVHEEEYEKREVRTPEEEVLEYYDHLVTDLDKDTLKSIARRIIK
jgi:DNA repair exonuclease SbcCD nuclease subunit